MKTFPTTHRFLAAVLAATFTISFAACPAPDNTDTGDDPGVDSQVAPSAEAASVAGTWLIHEEIDATACGEGQLTDDYPLTVVQDGNNLTFTAPDGRIYEGNVDGSRVRWDRSYPEEGGTTTVHADVTVAGDTISGNVPWEWSDGRDTCDGTTQVTGTLAVVSNPTSETPDGTAATNDGATAASPVIEVVEAPEDGTDATQDLGDLVAGDVFKVVGAAVGDGDDGYDYYLLNATEDLSVTVTLSIGDPAATDLDFELYAAGGLVGSANGTGGIESLTHVFTAGETVEIEVYAYSGSGPYELTIEAAPRDSGSSGSSGSGGSGSTGGGYTSIGSGSSNGGNTGTYSHEIWGAANPIGMNFNLTSW